MNVRENRLQIIRGQTPAGLLLFPAWDRLANEGVVFDRAYCASLLCVPLVIRAPGVRPGRRRHLVSHVDIKLD
jgi:arylsulfatase A-like enzyme